MDTREYYSPEQIRAFQDLLIGARRARNLTQGEVAKRVGVSQALISSLERAPTMGMRVGELFRVLAYYGIEPNTISDALGYAEFAERRTDDSRVSHLVNALDSVPNDVFDSILRALDLMVKGALESVG